MGRKRNFLLGWKTKLLPGAGFDSSHRVPAGQIPPFFLPRAGPQLRPRDLTGGQNLFFSTRDYQRARQTILILGQRSL
jgi:hypothetical protein